MEKPNIRDKILQFAESCKTGTCEYLQKAVILARIFKNKRSIFRWYKR